MYFYYLVIPLIYSLYQSIKLKDWFCFITTCIFLSCLWISDLVLPKSIKSIIMIIEIMVYLLICIFYILKSSNNRKNTSTIK